MTANEGQSDRMQEALAGLTAEEIAQMTPEELEALMPEEKDCFFLRKYLVKAVIKSDLKVFNIF